MNVVALKRQEATVRRYCVKDIARLAELTLTEVPKLPHYEGIHVDANRVKFLLNTNVNDESAFMVNVLVDDFDNVIGGISAYCVTQLLSNDKITSDIFLFIVPEYRTLQNAIKLIRSYIEWGKRRRATIIRATHTAGYRSDEVDLLLRKYCKFAIIGTIYNYVGA